MRRQLLPALRALLVFTVMVGLVYPLSILAVGQLAFPGRANGSLVEVDGDPVGSACSARRSRARGTSRRDPRRRGTATTPRPPVRRTSDR